MCVCVYTHIHLYTLMQIPFKLQKNNSQIIYYRCFISNCLYGFTYIYTYTYIYQNWMLINILIQVPGCICDVGFSWCSLFLLWVHCAFISLAGTTTIVLLEKDLLVILVNCVLHNYSSQSHFSWSICSTQVLFPYLITQRV